jgi:hypothetical protein
MCKSYGYSMSAIIKIRGVDHEIKCLEQSCNHQDIKIRWVDHEIKLMPRTMLQS